VTLTGLVVVVLAVTAVLVTTASPGARARPRARTSHDGLSIAGIIGPLRTLSVLLLVFVLGQTYASWSAAGDAETAEPTATLLLSARLTSSRTHGPGIACAPRSSARTSETLSTCL